jgi:hypothetical protein
MAKGKKTGGKDFPKGNSISPGRPPVPQEVKMIRQLTRDDLLDIGMLVVKGDVPALEDVLRRMKDPDPAKRPTGLQAAAASSILVAIKKGDVNILNTLLDRFFGKTPVAILVQSVHKHTHYTPDEAQAEARRLLAEAADA